MSQFGRPNSDITVTNFTGVFVNTSGNRYQNIDESSASSSDYVTGGTNTNATYECGLSAVTDPNDHTGHIVRFQAARTGFTFNLTVSLYQGTTLIRAFTQSLSSGSFTNFSFTLTEAEAANITNYSALRLRFVQPAQTSSSAQISWAELEVPDVVTKRYVPAFNQH